MKFKDNVWGVFWLLHFESSSETDIESKHNQIISINIEKALTERTPTQIIQRRNIENNALSTTVTNVQTHVQIVRVQVKPLPSIP